MVRRTVKGACPTSYPRAHDVRKMSVTKAFFTAMKYQPLKRGQHGNRVKYLQDTIYPNPYRQGKNVLLWDQY